MSLKTDAILIGAAVVGFYLLAKSGAVGQAAAAVAGAATQAAGDAVAGTAEGIGDVIGIPRTDKTQCQIDLENGDGWSASFSCPASVFLTYTFQGKEAAIAELTAPGKTHST